MAQPNLISTAPPAIRILKGRGAGSSESFVDLLNGIEEEGIPFVIEDSDLSDVAALGFEAANSSNLSVGLGLTSESIALHFDKLPEASPLFVLSRELDRHSIRALGMNAARLVKRMPFVL